MADAVTAKQIFEHLSPYDLERVTFCMSDGLPVVAAYIDTDMQGGAVVTLSDMPDGYEQFPQLKVISLRANSSD